MIDKREPVCGIFSLKFLPLLLALLIMPSSLIFAQTTASMNTAIAGFRNLASEDLLLLSQGQTVFRQPDNWRGLSVPVSASFYKEIEDTIRKGGHNYLGEVILVLPVAQAGS